MRYVFIALFLIAIAVSPAFAAGKEAAPRPIGVFGNWRAYKITERSQPVCYMTLTSHFPKKAGLHRGDAFLTVTHRPAESSKDVISFAAGYKYRPMSSAELRIGRQSFSLFTSEDTAWSRDAATDHKIAAAIRTAPALSITATPAQKGAAPLTDALRLKGADAAYRAIGKACGVEVAAVSSPKPARRPQPKAKKRR